MIIPCWKVYKKLVFWLKWSLILKHKYVCTLMHLNDTLLASFIQYFIHNIVFYKCNHTHNILYVWLIIYIYPILYIWSYIFCSHFPPYLLFYKCCLLYSKKYISFLWEILLFWKTWLDRKVYFQMLGTCNIFNFFLHFDFAPFT